MGMQLFAEKRTRQSSLNNIIINQDLFSDSETDCDSSDFVTQISKKKQSKQHSIETLLDTNTLTDERPPSHQVNVTQNMQTQPSNKNTNTNSEHIPQKHTSDTTLQIHKHTEKATTLSTSKH